MSISQGVTGLGEMICMLFILDIEFSAWPR